MNLATPSVQAVKAYLHYRCATSAVPITALDVEGNVVRMARVVRLTTREIALGVCADLGRCVSQKTISLALSLLRREGLLLTLRSPVMGDVAGFHLLLDGEWSHSPEVQDLKARYQERIMTGYDYRRVSLPVLTPTRSTPVPAAVQVDVEITFPAPAPADADFLEADYNPFDVEETATAVVVEVAPEADCGCPSEKLTKQQAKALERAAKQAERERVKAEKANADAALTAAARPIVDCYIAYASEVKGSINYGLIWKKAKEMADAGFTVDDVSNYISHLRSQNFYRTRFITILFIRDNIGSYLHNSTARDGYDAYGRFDIRLTKRAQEENARLDRESAERAAANGGVDPGEDKTESLAMLHAFLASKPQRRVATTPA